MYGPGQGEGSILSVPSEDRGFELRRGFITGDLITCSPGLVLRWRTALENEGVANFPRSTW